MENYQFEWSESGLELLDTVNKIIEENGGINVMYAVVNAEVNEFAFKKEKRVKLDLLKIIKTYGMPIKDALSILQMTKSQYERFKAENK